MPEDDVRSVLVAHGLVRDEHGRPRTTPRWQAALARAALRLQQAGAPWVDLRLPIAAALVELRPELPDEELARLVEALLPIEQAGLGPVLGGAPAAADRGVDHR